jgi:hypothetical protein
MNTDDPLNDVVPIAASRKYIRLLSVFIRFYPCSSVFQGFLHP